MKKPTALGTLLTAFKQAKWAAISEGRKRLYDRNRPKNSEEKATLEIREFTTSADGKTDIILELWQKVDSEHIRISAGVETKIIDREDIGGMLK